VKREGVINIKDNKIRKSILTVNFHNYTLYEDITEFNNKNSSKNKNEINYKCRKIILN